MLYYGCDYYPEHWPESRWTEDARLMREAGFNVVRIGEFAWAKMEPVEAHYDWAWLDHVISILADHGLQVVLGTPTAAPPPWLTTAYPEVLPLDQYRRIKGPGTRHHVCANSPVYQDQTRRIVIAMAERYGQDPRVIGWQTDNEFGCHDTARCYCDRCARAFREWLQVRYGFLDVLNTAWGTEFWSQTYTDWEQVPLPWAAPAEHNPSLLLDFRRFASDSWVAYQQIQVAILRRLAPDQFITHNMIGFFDLLDYYDLSEPLDFVSWDNYHYHEATPALIAAAHDLTWGLKQRNFWVMEQQVGQINWSPYNPALRPGEVRLKTYQDIAHGTDGVIYFRWRAARIGSEQYHSGLLNHSAHLTRGYEEAKQVGAELQRLSPLLDGTAPQPQVAILQDYENRWILQLQPHNRQLADLDGLPAFWLSPYHVLYNRNVPVTFVHPNADLSPFQLVIAPFLNLLSEGTVANLTDFVSRGGTLIIGPRAGFKDRSNRVFDSPPPGPLAELVGVTVDEFDSLPPGCTNTIRFVASELAGREVTVNIWCEVLTPTTGQVLACYTADYYAEAAAITRHHYGQGQVIYIGVLGNQPLYELLLDWLLPGTDVRPLLNTPLGVEAALRAGEGRRILFLMNHTPQTQEVSLPARYRDLLTGRLARDTVSLPGRAVLILESL
jgi:beta-galactosidase